MPTARTLMYKNFRLRGAALVFGSLLSAQACADGNSNKEQEDGPLALEIVGFENAQGETFEPDDRITVACDRRLTVLLGPSDTTPHLLDNWNLRPPGDCADDQKRCGFVRLLLRYADDTTVTVERASLAIVLSDEFVTSKLESVTATLIDSHDGSLFLVDDQAVTDRSDLALSFSDCPNSGSGGNGGSELGGAGGEAGGSGLTPGGASFGGSNQ